MLRTRAAPLSHARERTEAMIKFLRARKILDEKDEVASRATRSRADGDDLSHEPRSGTSAAASPPSSLTTAAFDHEGNPVVGK
jgi:hypothetical protein